MNGQVCQDAQKDGYTNFLLDNCPYSHHSRYATQNVNHKNSIHYFHDHGGGDDDDDHHHHQQQQQQVRYAKCEPQKFYTLLS